MKTVKLEESASRQKRTWTRPWGSRYLALKKAPIRPPQGTCKSPWTRKFLRIQGVSSSRTSLLTCNRPWTNHKSKTLKTRKALASTIKIEIQFLTHRLAHLALLPKTLGTVLKSVGKAPSLTESQDWMLYLIKELRIWRTRQTRLLSSCESHSQATLLAIRARLRVLPSLLLNATSQLKV